MEMRAMSWLSVVEEHVREHRFGMVSDLAFAIAWVTLVTIVFGALGGPTWAYYLSMAAGVLAYYGYMSQVEYVRSREKS